MIRPQFLAFKGVVKQLQHIVDADELDAIGLNVVQEVGEVENTGWFDENVMH